MSLRHPISALLAISIPFVGSVCFLRAARTLTGSTGDGGTRIPVLVGLLTSEGCPSCPPADALLHRLDRSQPVVDGRFEFVGSDERRANEAIKGAGKSRKAPVSISFASGDREAATVHIEAGPLPSSVAVHPAGVFLAIADNSDESQVSRGEN